MATGDIIWFNAALSLDYLTGFLAADNIKIAILDDTLSPAADLANPALGASTLTEVGSGGSYTAGGETLNTWGNMWDDATAGGTGTFDDTDASVSWTQNGSNDTDAYWGLIYNDDRTTPVADPALCYVDLGGPVDMSAGSLTITWNASGIATLTTAV
jgi:hypothetical protein